MNENRYTYVSQFAILIGTFGMGIIFSALMVQTLGAQMMHVPPAKVAEALNLPQNADMSRLLNTIASFFSFFLPAFILARVLSRRPFRQLGFNSVANIQQVLLIVIITFSCMVLSGALGELNERIPLPANWEAKAKSMEDTYRAATMSMANMKGPVDYLLALIVLAFFPALFEETLFRGGFQQVFIGWTNSKWTGIIITSVLFSAIHFSYFGFLPRAALGIVMGLVFYYGKNIWLNIFLHFVYNGFIVTQLYLVNLQGKKIEKTMDESMPLWWGAIALIVLVVFMRSFRQKSEELLLQHPSRIKNSTPDDPLS